MAVPANPDLYQMISDFEARKRRDFRSMGMSMVPALAAGLEGGPRAAAATAAQFYAQPEDRRMDPAQKAKIKADLLGLLAQRDKDRMEGRINAAKQLKDQNSLIQELLKQSVQVGSNQAQADATVISSLNQALTAIDRNYGEYLGKAIAAVGPHNAGGVERALDAMTKALSGAGDEGPNSPINLEGVANEIIKLTEAMDFGAVAALKARADQVALQFGYEGGLKQWLAENQNTVLSNGRVGDRIGTALSYLENPNVVGLAAQINEEAGRLAFASKMATAGKLIGGASSVSDKARKFFMQMLPLLDDKPGMGQGQDVGAEIDAILGEQDNTTPDAVAKLLNQLDQEDLPPASNLAEAKRRILASDEFKQWMTDNGYQHPDTAFKALVQAVNANNHKLKQQDRALNQQRRLANVGATTNTGPVTAEAVNKGTEAQPPEKGVKLLGKTIGQGVADLQRAVANPAPTFAGLEAKTNQALRKLFEKKKPATPQVEGETEETSP